MKHKIIGAIIAATMTIGASTSFAEPDPNSPAGQDLQSGQSSQDQSVVSPAPGEELEDPAGASSRAFDKDMFLKETAKSGMAEVNMAQLGTQKGQDPELKEVAQKLVTDHSKLNDQIKELAEKKGVTLSTSIDPKHQKMIDHLSGLSGAEFDKAFASHMVQGHKKSIARFKKAAANTEDTEISELAKTTLPTLQEHLLKVQKFAPGETAGAEVDEAAGAQSEKDDSGTVSPDSTSPDSSSESDKPDSTNPDSSGTP